MAASPLRAPLAPCLLGFRGADCSPAFAEAAETLRAGSAAVRPGPGHPIP